MITQKNPHEMTTIELMEEIKSIQESLKTTPSKPFDDYDHRSFRLYNLISEVNKR
jgi:hypothetical protein